MTPAIVRDQIDCVIGRMLDTSLSVQQNRPTERRVGGHVYIGDLPGVAMALRDIPYNDLYVDLERNNLFHVKLPDGALLAFQYTFLNDELIKHRLAFFPAWRLPSMEEAPDLYERDEMFAEIRANRLVRFPIRIDFDPDNHRDVRHPKAHLSLGQFENCRIPVTAPVLPYAFAMFVLRNFYCGAYTRFKNKFERHLRRGRPPRCITPAEERIPHFVIP